MAGLEGSTLMIDLSIVGIYSLYLTTLVSNKIGFISTYHSSMNVSIRVCSYCILGCDDRVQPITPSALT
jgi:hypothetical protein